MPVKIESNAEPLPGYRLIERLGGGGFGEVWKAQAPGGLFKAIKFVYGDIEGADEEGARAEQELKAMKRVQEVRHPYILSLERYDIIEGQLMIVMELADRTLWDRFKECRSEGLLGIPRMELLSYLREWAEALDLMNNQYQLQHLDIKPQNLFLVHNHVKVADFGLIKDLEGTKASITGGVTPVYAAPETFDGEVRRSTDQYSLAIVYQELLTGHRPFAGTTARQLVLQHLQASPDLSALPPADRPIVGRALHKHYAERFDTCDEFIQALLSATTETAIVPLSSVIADPSVPSLSGSRTSGNTSSGLSEVLTNGQPATEGTNRLSGTAPGKNGRLPRTEGKAPPPLPSAASIQLANDKTASFLEEAPNLANDKTTPSLGGAPLPPSVPSSQGRLALGLSGSHELGLSATHVQSRRRHTPEAAGAGVLRPALVIGLGQCGQVILHQLRQQLLDTFGGFGAVGHIRFLYLDTDAANIQQSMQGGEHALRHCETLLTRLHRPSHYLKSRDYAKRIGNWLPEKALYRIPRQQVANATRALGRLAFVDNFGVISQKLSAELAACLDEQALQQAGEETGLGVGSAQPRVYIVTSLAGGTGSGMLLDLGFTLRKLLKKRGQQHPDLVGVCLMPTTGRTQPQKAGLANVYAALTEIHHFNRSGASFAAVYSGNDDLLNNGVFTETGPPFHRCLFVAADAGSPAQTADSQMSDSATPAALEAASLVFTELCTHLGQIADKLRLGRREGAAPRAVTRFTVYQAAGLHTINWPRRSLLRQVGRRLCHQLIQRWMNKKADFLRDSVQQWTQQQWDKLQLRSEDLIQRLQGVCEAHFQGRPETLLHNAIDQALAPTDTPPPAAPLAASRSSAERINPGNVLRAVAALDQLLGPPEGCRPLSGRSADTPLGTLLPILEQGTVGIGNTIEVQIAELMVRLIEEPDFRLAGAEEALRQFSNLVQKALNHQEDLAKEIRERSASHYGRIRTLLEQPDKASASQSGWKLGRKRGADQGAAGEVQDLLRHYAKSRYHSLILEQVGAYYVTLRGQLTDQLRDVDYCRHRLRELATCFAEPSGEGANPASHANGIANAVPVVNGRAAKPTAGAEHGLLLLPNNCRTLAEAVEQGVKRFTPADLIELDRAMEQMIRSQFRALVHICTASANLLRNVAPAMQTTAEAFFESRLEEADVIQMYLDRLGDNSPEVLSRALTDCFEKARSALAIGAPAAEMCLLAAPPAPQREKFCETARLALRIEAPIADAADEIVLYREQIFASPGEIQQLQREPKEVYEQLRSHEHLTPHSRTDIAEWRSLEG